MIVEARQIAPAFIAADLDHARTELGAEQHPAEDDDDDHRRREVAPSEKRGEEARFEELDSQPNE